jgi:hypothetical protein
MPGYNDATGAQRTEFTQHAQRERIGNMRQLLASDIEHNLRNSMA